MSFFHQPKPRRFHHEYIFVDKRKDKLKAIEQRAKENLEKDDAKSYDTSRLRGTFLNATKYARRHKEKRLSGGFVLNIGAIVVIVIVLVFVWRMLLSL